MNNLTKEEIFAKHWKSRTGKDLDETTKQHMTYCLDAMQEFKDQETIKYVSAIGKALKTMKGFGLTSKELEWAIKYDIQPLKIVKKDE